jgi:hypothetical protein
MAKEQRRSRLSIDVPLEAHRLVNELASGDLTALTEQADPVLAELSNNPRDAAYDKL